MLAVLRVRGRTGIRPKAEKTAALLRLHRINHMVIVPENDVYKGMLQTAKDYLTWGEIDKETLILLLKHRAQLKGHRSVSEEDLKALGFSSYEDLADAILSGKVKYSDLEGVVPVFRLNPPTDGYESIRKPYNQDGTLGYRGSSINELIRRMLVSGVDLNGQGKN